MFKMKPDDDMFVREDSVRSQFVAPNDFLNQSPAPRVRVSFQQLEALITYLETRPRLAKGDIGSSTEGRREARLGWQTAANILNALDLGNGNGANKTASQWSQYWSSYKNKFKAKLKNRISSAESGEIELSKLEQRVKVLLGPSFGHPHGSVRVDVDPDLPTQDCDYPVDVVDEDQDVKSNPIGWTVEDRGESKWLGIDREQDELPTEDVISSLSGTSTEEPTFATVKVEPLSDAYDRNSDEAKSDDPHPQSAPLQPRVSRVVRPPATAPSRFRQMNGSHQKLECLRSNRMYEKAIHKRTLQYMEEKRQEERELFELKKKKLLLEISALENKLLNSFYAYIIFIPL